MPVLTHQPSCWHFILSLPEISIELITPEQAQRLLERNFSDNRKATQATVTRYANQMKLGQWYLSTDAIAISSDGELVNGQHRLQALVRSGQSCEFIFVKNFPREHVKCLDIGKKRQMHERITIEGVPMTIQECSIIRNAFSSYSSSTLGAITYSELRHDSFVSDEFKRHSKFLQFLAELGYIKNGVPNFFAVGALYVFTEIDHRLTKYKDNSRYEYITDNYSFPALTRSLQFLELVNTGTLEHSGSFKSSRDIAAKALYDSYRDRKAKGKYWSGFDQLNHTLSAASNFANERGIRILNKTKTLPFTLLSKCRPANEAFVDTLQDNEEYLTEKQLIAAHRVLLNTFNEQP